MQCAEDESVVQRHMHACGELLEQSDDQSSRFE